MEGKDLLQPWNWGGEVEDLVKQRKLMMIIVPLIVINTLIIVYALVLG